MSLSPKQARLALGAFACIGLVIAGNVLFLQSDGPSRSEQRARLERTQERAERERQRRLALKASETPREASREAPRDSAREIPALARRPAPGVLPAAAMSGPEAGPSQPLSRTGRFAPSASDLGDATIPTADPESRAVEVVRTVQRGLAERGYEPGTPDGVAGLVTRAAVMAYEHDNGLPLTAEPSELVLRHMQTGLVPPSATRPTKSNRMPHAEQLVRSVQQSLSTLGYFAGRIDGFMGDDSVRAIREYEMDQGLVPTGRVSGPLVARLARAGARTGR